mgnify:FL=1
MKKLVFTMYCIFMSVSVFAQNNITWEGQIGLNVAKLTHYESLIGYNLGVRAKMELPVENLYVNMGALLSRKGASFDLGEAGNTKIKANYLDIPVHVGYQYVVNNDFSVFGEFGPYFAIGLFGKSKGMEGDINDEGDVLQSPISYNTFDQFKRFDFGLGLRVGTEIKKKYILAFSYDFGFINGWKSYQEENDWTASCKNRNFSISLGYKF